MTATRSIVGEQAGLPFSSLAAANCGGNWLEPKRGSWDAASAMTCWLIVLWFVGWGENNNKLGNEHVLLGLCGWGNLREG